MNILIFAGTINGRELALALAKGGHQVHVSSASGYGDSLLAKHERLTSSFGKLTMEAMSALILKTKTHCIIDSTHPYAVEISENLIIVAKALGIRLLRYEREQAIDQEQGRHFLTMASACRYLDQQSGNVLFTTGVNDLKNIVHWMDKDRVYVRILPIESSLDLAQASGLDQNQVVAMKPPFSLEQNLAHIKAFNIKYLVTKDSGKEGHIEEKLEAVKTMGIHLVVVDRPVIAFHHLYYSEEAIMKALS